MDTILNARIDEAVDRLADEFKGIFSPETVSRSAFESLEAFERSRLVEYVPLLTYSLHPRAPTGAGSSGGAREKGNPRGPVRLRT